VVFDYPEKMIDGSMIQRTDKQAFIGGTTTPVIGARVMWGGTLYSVISVKPLAPALVAVLYEVQLRTA